MTRPVTPVTGPETRPVTPVTRGALLVGVMLALAALAGCSNPTDDYCGTLQDQQQTLKDLARSAGRPAGRPGAQAGGDPFGDSLAVFTQLRDAAPDDIRDEWDTFVFAWEDLVDAFDEAGVDPRGYKPGAKLPGVSDAQREAIDGAAAELQSARVVDAGKGIEQHARDVCKVDLGQ